MSLIKLTENLENFQWTDYSKAGTGKSPQPDGTDYFERPNPKSLEQMESKFGKLDTQPTTRGPYGVSNTMDGTKQGRGFIQPGSSPKGFTKNMDLLHNPSELVIGKNLTRTPLSYEVAGVTSNLSYGQVDQKELKLEPQAEGAWGNTTLPISTYSSRQPIEDIPVGAIGGYNTYYGNLDLLSSRTSKFQKPDGSYTTPEEPLFEGGQRTFTIPAAYPENTSAYTIDSQLGWSHSNKFLGISGGPWGNIPSEWIENKITRHEVPWTQAEIDRGWQISDEVGDTRENSFKEVYTTTQTIVHPIQPLNLHSVPNYNAPSWLELQFLTNYDDSNHTWPYKVLNFGEEGTHPFIRKDVGERYPVGQGVENWMALQVVRTLDDIDRIDKFLETPKGVSWVAKQIMLQGLNPRDETRTFNLPGVEASILPLFHVKRHGGIYGGENYMEVADFGPLFPDGTTTQGDGFMSILAGLWGGGIFANGLSGDLKLDTFGKSSLSDMGVAFGAIDFNEQGAGGRLRYLTSKFIVGDSLSGLTSFIANADPFGRTPKVPRQTTFSQRGAFGRGDANKNYDDVSLINRYATLAYGDIGGGAGGTRNLRYGDMSDVKNSLYTHREIADPSSFNIFDVNTEGGTNLEYDKRIAGNKIVQDIGQQGKLVNPVFDTVEDFGAGLGQIKKGNLASYKNELTDKINILPYGLDNTNDPDFIKFKFKDIYNNKFIVFRAILSGISDAITPEWSGTKYLGRPDQVYVYSGTERKVSFNFEIYPKTKQEFPVLMEKLNYLIGLCYPSFTSDNRMVAPFINLTLGDMFKDTPGFLDSLSVDVDDTGTWETEEGLQFPKHITCNCSFTYVGKYLPSTLGKHYELNWLEDFGNAKVGDTTNMGTFQVGQGGDIKNTQKPVRNGPMNELFEQGLYPEKEGTQVSDNHGTQFS